MRQTPADHLEDTFGNPELVELHVGFPPPVALHEGPGLGEVPKDLADEERIALGLAGDGFGEIHPLFVEVVAGGVGEELLDARPVESVQCEPFDATLAPQVGEHLRERMRAVEVGVTVRRDDQEVQGDRRSQQMAEQQQGGFACPVDIVEHQHHRLARRQVAQQVGRGLEEPVPFGLGIVGEPWFEPGQTLGEIGDERRELASARADEFGEHVGWRRRCQPAQGLDEGLVGDEQFFVARTPQDDAVTVVRGPAQLLHQAGLADPGLAGDEDRLTPADRRGLPGHPE
jgi:hypothetical protein